MNRDKPEARDTQDNRVRRVTKPDNDRQADIRPDAGVPPPSRVLNDVLARDPDKRATRADPEAPSVEPAERPSTPESLATNALGTSVGAMGGVAAGAMVGAAGGPVGALAGAAAGAVAGGMLGGGAGRLSASAGTGGVATEHNAPSEAQWRTHHEARRDLANAPSYEECADAYRFGADARERLGAGAAWDDAATSLATEWKTGGGGCALSWDEAMPAVRAAWEGHTVRRA